MVERTAASGPTAPKPATPAAGADLGAGHTTLPATALHASLADTHRLEMVGQLAGGVAHEFNNLLTVMQGHLERLAAELPAASAGHERIDALERAVADAARITAGLLTFAGRTPGSPAVLDLAEALREIAPVVDGLVGEGVRVEWVLGSRPLPVAIDRAHLAQLVANLALNARDAMPDGGRLTVTTRGEDSPGEGAGAALLSVEDSGHGMHPEVRAQIFEPFYTTRERPSRGRGLGLSICLGIVARAGGDIDVRSSPGTGTSVLIRVPLAPHTPTAAGPPSPPAATPRRLALTVLLVEDEPDVRGIVAEILRRHGHHVLPVDGVDAVRRLLSAAPPRVDLLLTDLVLADGTGLEVARLITAHAPATPVLYMSGYSEAVFSGDQPVDHLIRKPFTSAALLDALHRVVTPARPA
jgi:CheY-like chemotaxis protein